MSRAAALALALALAALPAGAGAACRHALAVGLDDSGSVDAREYALQHAGLAQALLSPPVRALLLEDPAAPVWLAVYDWSGPADQRPVLDWTELRDGPVLEDAAARIAGARRGMGALQTAVGSALLYGEALLALRGDCPRLTLDLSGDGVSNLGPRPRDVRLARTAVPVTVNALAVGAGPAGSPGEPGTAELAAWFAAEVIRGPDAFVETATGFEDFAAAMERKLLRELGGVRVGTAQ